MKHLYVFTLPCFIMITACSVSSPTLSSSQESSRLSTTAVPQIQKSPIDITCQDLQNPAYQQAMLASINQIRQHPRQCGQQYFPAVPPLTWNNSLHTSSFAHAQDMATHNFLGHTSSNGLNLRSRFQLYHVKTHGGAENVARGQKNLDEVMASWLSSPIHCSNLMQSRFTDYAVACAPDQSAKQKSYWTQQFGVR